MKVDITIIGAGPAGLCFARALADTGLNILLIEKQEETALADPAYDGREIALTHLSHKLMSELGLWDLIPDDGISLIRSAKVLNGKSSYALHFDYRESGKDNLGFMISNHLIRKAAYDAVKQCGNIKIISGVAVETVETDDIKGTVTLSDGTIINAPLVIAADSRFSKSRKMMGIEASMLDFGRTCIVCRMQAEKPHDKTAYECFHFDRTLAVLPLNENKVSAVITLDTKDAENVLNMSDEDFGVDITERMENRFGDITLISRLYSYPLVAVYANSFYARRFALIGDAAVGMHPVTAHGFNLGLRGGYTLAQEIKSALSVGSDIGSTTLLRRYHDRHYKDTRPLYLGTNALVKLYTKDDLPARIARRALLRLGNKIAPAKRLIMNQLTESDAA
ncbi:MAG: 5-demethoxyubiquinol-8 5-hydroxylase UbiM [Rhodospirillales bacterium]|nr:5-demethoxyubiquinol-8 5-hydroxylase UbiM [Rhodospirillales bacterium]MCB9995009.1 5-demethoxyubiquinol-8 5-hydroxylase UbiM [Rhodospirillales bacterium]